MFLRGIGIPGEMHLFWVAEVVVKAGGPVEQEDQIPTLVEEEEMKLKHYVHYQLISVVAARSSQPTLVISIIGYTLDAGEAALY